MLCDKIEEIANEKPNFVEDDKWALIKVAIAYIRVCVRVRVMETMMVSTPHSILREWSGDMSQTLCLGCGNRISLLALDEPHGFVCCNGQIWRLILCWFL